MKRREGVGEKLVGRIGFRVQHASKEFLGKEKKIVLQAEQGPSKGKMEELGSSRVLRNKL